MAKKKENKKSNPYAVKNSVFKMKSSLTSSFSNFFFVTAKKKRFNGNLLLDTDFHDKSTISFGKSTFSKAFWMEDA